MMNNGNVIGELSDKMAVKRVGGSLTVVAVGSCQRHVIVGVAVRRHDW